MSAFRGKADIDSDDSEAALCDQVNSVSIDRAARRSLASMAHFAA
jgi:hypothetical protein